MEAFLRIGETGFSYHVSNYGVYEKAKKLKCARHSYITLTEGRLVSSFLFLLQQVRVLKFTEVNQLVQDHIAGLRYKSM